MALSVEQQARVICAAVDNRKVHRAYWMRRREHLGHADQRALAAVEYALRLKALKHERFD